MISTGPKINPAFRRRIGSAFPFFVVKLRRLVSLLSIPVALVLSACAPLPPATELPPPLETLATLPPELTEALQGFRPEGPRGWAFTQTTSDGDKARVERYNPRQRGSARWTLLSDNGTEPTDEEQEKYRASRPIFDAATNLVGQLDRSSVAIVARDEAATTYEFRLNPTSDKDIAAPYMRARFTYDRTSRVFTRIELFSVQAFKPAMSLTIFEARTTLSYLPPGEGLPALPDEVVMHVRGRRFFASVF